MIRPAAAWHEISKPARRLAAIPPPMPFGGVGPTPSRPSQLPGAARLQAKALKRVEAKQRDAARKMAARTFKKDADAAQALKDLGRRHLPRHAAPQTGKPVPTALPEVCGGKWRVPGIAGRTPAVENRELTAGTPQPACVTCGSGVRSSVRLSVQPVCYQRR